MSRLQPSLYKGLCLIKLARVLVQYPSSVGDPSFFDAEYSIYSKIEKYYRVIGGTIDLSVNWFIRHFISLITQTLNVAKPILQLTSYIAIKIRAKNDYNIGRKQKRVILLLNRIKKSKQIIIVIDRFDDRLRETSQKLFEKIETQARKWKKIHMEKSRIGNASRILRKVIFD